jgi:hypothetical protein
MDWGVVHGMHSVACGFKHFRDYRGVATSIRLSKEFVYSETKKYTDGQFRLNESRHPSGIQNILYRPSLFNKQLLKFCATNMTQAGHKGGHSALCWERQYYRLLFLSSAARPIPSQSLSYEICAMKGSETSTPKDGT